MVQQTAKFRLLLRALESVPGRLHRGPTELLEEFCSLRFYLDPAEWRRNARRRQQGQILSGRCSSRQKFYDLWRRGLDFLDNVIRIRGVCYFRAIDRVPY